MLDDWALAWGISPEAMHDLRVRLGIADWNLLPSDEDGASESRVQSLIRLEAAENGVWLTRNNVGALLDSNNRLVRYGLANESKEQNRTVKSGDLIGIRKILIGPHHVGRIIGQFVSREVKHGGWTYKGDQHEKAQLAWANFVNSNGGDAAFAEGPGSFRSNK